MFSSTAAIRLGLFILPLTTVDAEAQIERDRYRDHFVSFAGTIGIPGAFGISVEMRLVGPIEIRGSARGIFEERTRGIEVMVNLAHSSDGRLYVTGGAGQIICESQSEVFTPCDQRPDRSTGLAVGVGMDFPISASRSLAAGVEIQRWFSLDDAQPSLFTAVFVLRLYY